MRIEYDIPFVCPDESMMGHLMRIFAGEYDVPYYPAHPPTILDVGANVGAFSVWASHRWPGSRVYAYEPHPVSFESLVINTSRCLYVNSSSHGIGRAGMRPLFDGVNNPGEASFYDFEFPIDGRVARLVKVLDPLTMPHADILKIDVEGAEMEVLAPLIDAGREFGAVMIEYHRADYRRRIDELLAGYVLTGSLVYSSDMGVVRYVNKKYLA
jgi:FkbM family methyltransferase